jgi:uncharacterized protein YbaR (Trm112 family)
MMAKVSTTEHNLANWIAEHVRRAFPELANDPIHGVWFTGSNVWSLAYGIPSPDAGIEDWDIFAIGDEAAAEVARRLDLVACPACRTKDKRKDPKRTVDDRHVPVTTQIPMLDDDDRPTGGMAAYGEGYSYVTPRGEIDLWISTPGNVVDELRTYPDASHAHRRMAFSFTDGLVMLPNECARPGAAP